MSVVEGSVGGGEGKRWAVVVSRFNSGVTERLLTGCLEAFDEGGVAREDVEVAKVPGAVEIPLICDRFAGSGDYAAVVALGCVIRGETSHYDSVCRMVSRGVLEAGLRHGVPVIFGVLTTDSEEQAMARAADGYSNKGYEAGLAALEMASLIDRLEPGPA